MKHYFSDERAQFRIRLVIAFAFVLILFGVLLSRFFYLQVSRYHEFQQKARANRISLIPTPPVRGEIIDAQGVVLAHNYPAFSLEIIPDQLEQSVDETIELIKPYVHISESNLRQFKRFRASSRHYDSIPLKLKLTEPEAALLSSELYRLKGVNISARTFREYPYGNLTAHFVGYIGRIGSHDLDRLKEENRTALYRGTTHIGKSGLEAFYEDYLHGTPGFQEVEKDAQGNIIQVLRHSPPHNGQVLQLAMDIRMQAYADKLLDNRRGAIVAINPQNGQVLAMVSKPSFDANLFIDGIDTESWNALNTDRHRPLINRAIQGLYPPGSTFKPFMAIGALESKSITPASMLYSPGAWSIPGTKHQFRDSVSSGHGSINLSKAIAVSSDTFFYQLGYKMGIDNITRHLAPFGFGEKTHIDLPNEYIGVLPSRAWKEKRFAKSRPTMRTWLPADTVSVSIGQGYNIYTPLQMAQATAILASGGKVFWPHLAQSLIDHEDQKRILIEANQRETVAYAPQHFEFIKRSMQKVLQPGGTAWRTGEGLKYTMAGKTGTAQVRSIKQGERYNAKMLAEEHRDHAWFIAFAPVENPQIAVAVLLENGGWGASAAPLARSLIDFYLLPHDDKPLMQPTVSTEEFGNYRSDVPHSRTLSAFEQLYQTRQQPEPSK